MRSLRAASAFEGPPPRGHLEDLKDLSPSKLKMLVKGIDFNDIRKRRAIYCRLYHEAVASHQRGKGIGFTDMLLLLAHHKLIVDREALE